MGTTEQWSFTYKSKTWLFFAVKVLAAAACDINHSEIFVCKA
jgi:hypothetical protein